MLLKAIIIILIIAMLISLGVGFYFVIKDQGNKNTRILTSLKFRICIATAIIICISYGIGSGQFSSQAPWDKQIHPERTQ